MKMMNGTEESARRKMEKKARETLGSYPLIEMTGNTSIVFGGRGGDRKSVV